MAIYEYHAIRAEGDEDKSFIGGIVVARDRSEAKSKLREPRLKRARGIMAVIKWLDADIR